MITVNALKLRNNLGEILDWIQNKKEPVIVTKGRKIRAVMITPELYKTRFLDYQAQHDRDMFLKRILTMRVSSTEEKTSLEILRELRGYDE
jgi:PHD/YefM family antitoxin component YafN of YafNO toxin-antitoxin module